ncbi:hypothetical protein GGS20DRAFT_234765 [Poronia punctata]|nr:hypothetical protein GGS20DRAFT_234765 [Poronia punctata]
MDRHNTPPFALQLFYRTGAFHRPDEFSTNLFPPSLTLHTWSDCTLDELAQQIIIAGDKLLPNPAIGTRLVFRLLYQDTRAAPSAATTTATTTTTNTMSSSSSSSKYTVRELGSVVIGDGGPGLDPDDAEAERTPEDTDPDKTLGEARFVVGDFISCAILPPLADGSVAPASSARMGRGAGAGEARVAVGRAPIGPLRGRDGPFSARRGGRGGLGKVGFDSGGFHGGRGPRGGGFPSGEWRRGEQLPDVPPGGHARSRGNRF